VPFSKRCALVCVVLLIVTAVSVSGCGYYRENRVIARGRKAVSKEKKDVEELESVRGELRRVVDMKIKAVRYLESTLRLLGEKYMEIGSYNLAEDALVEAELLQPYNAYVKKDLGQCCYFLAIGAVDASKRDEWLLKSNIYYRSALDIKPDLLEALYGYGILLALGYEDYDAAIEQMKLLLAYDPENTDAHFALGRFYYEIGDLGKSLGEYLALSRLLPRSSPKQLKVEENILRINRETGIDGS
jgi:cytochrome c-type biogenesis protein CcmH/NrfG